MPFYDLTCPNDHQQIDKLLKIGERPPCPECGEPTITLWTGKANSVIADDIPGGIWMKHGVCNDDGTPKKYYSKSEIAKAAKAKGLEPYVRHIGERGSDKSKNTTRWV